MDLKRALGCGARLSYGGKWLVVNHVTDEYEVWEHKHGAKSSTLVISTMSEEDAVKALMQR
jgi:hypothetical protein